MKFGSRGIIRGLLVLKLLALKKLQMMMLVIWIRSLLPNVPTRHVSITVARALQLQRRQHRVVVNASKSFKRERKLERFMMTSVPVSSMDQANHLPRHLEKRSPKMRSPS